MEYAKRLKVEGRYTRVEFEIRAVYPVNDSKTTPDAILKIVEEGYVIPTENGEEFEDYRNVIICRMGIWQVRDLMEKLMEVYSEASSDCVKDYYDLLIGAYLEKLNKEDLKKLIELLQDEYEAREE